MAKQRKRKPYGKASWAMREAVRATAPTDPKVLAASALAEDLYLRGFSAVQDGDLSFEAVTAAVQNAVTEYKRAQAGGPYAGAPCQVVATFLGDAVYQEEGKFYQVPYKLSGNTAEITGAPEEVAAEFQPTAGLSESRDHALIEARPAGTLRPGSLKRDLNVIEGTVLITSLSQNGSGKGGRRYSDAALKQIAAMAEGLPAYLNHVAAEQAFKPRDVRDLIGVHRNVRYHPTEGKITSDLHVMEHQAPLVFGIAERLGDHVGNSLVSRGLVQMEGDTEVVKEVLAVRSADLVSDPATTKGLFESRTEHSDPFGALIAEIRESLTTTKEESMDLAAILAHLKATPADQKALAEHFGFVLKGEASQMQEALVAPLKAEITALTEAKSALALRADKAETDLKAATVKIDAFEAKEALATKRAKIETVLAEHDLGKKYGKNEAVVSPTFRQALVEAAEDQWGAMLDDRYKAVQGAPAPTTPRSGLKPEPAPPGTTPNGAHARLIEAVAQS